MTRDFGIYLEFFIPVLKNDFQILLKEVLF